MGGIVISNQYSIVANMHDTAIITLKYRPVLLLGAPPKPPK